MVHTTLIKDDVSITYTDVGLKVSTPEDAVRVLDERGVAIVSQVIDSAQCNALYDSLCATMSHVTQNCPTPFNGDDPATFSVISELAPMHDTLHQQWGLSHDPEVWKLRAAPKILDVFAALYDVNRTELVASIDGVNMGPRNRGFGGHHKLHSDERPHSALFETVQGWVSPIDVPAGAGTLRFLDGSDKLKRVYAERHAAEFADPANSAYDPKSDWHVVSTGQPNPFYAGCPDSAVVCKAGDLVLWRSSTVHSGIEAWRDEDLEATGVAPLGITDDPFRPFRPFRVDDPHRPFRMAAYVSYMPRSECPPASFGKRKKILLNPADPLFGRSCSHYADMRRTFGRYPATYPRLARVKADERWAHIVPYTPDPTIFEDEAVRRVAGL